MKNSRIISGLALCALIGLSLAGCQGAASSTFSPVTPSGLVTSNLMWLVLAIAAVVFVVVEGLLLLSIFKFRHKGETYMQQKDLPEQVEGNQTFETAWTLAPAIVLAVLFVLTLLAMQAIVTPPAETAASPAVVNLRVTGHQWWWQFDYPDLKITTADEFHVPLNTVVMVSVQSADVIHSYWVPQFGGKIDVIPGHVNATWFKATQLGVFNGQCSEYCGEEHAQMAFHVIVDSPEDYKAWVAQQQSKPGPMSGPAAVGEHLFMKGACAGCHTVQGTTAAGKVAPDLTHIASRSIFSGGVSLNTPANLKTWVTNPPAVKPGVKMPKLPLSADNITALVAYLEALK